MSLTDGSIKLVWNCDMADKCINKDDPGKHRGDQGYNEMCLCRGELVIEDRPEPTPLKRLR